MKIFTTWTFAGRRYIAVRNGDGEQVADETGRWFGSWQDHKTFRKRQQEGKTDELAMGTVNLAARVAN